MSAAEFIRFYSSSLRKITPALYKTLLAERMNWHTLEINSALSELDSSSEAGLTTAQVKTRLKQFGLNQLVERGENSLFKILWGRFASPLTLILIAAGALAAFNADYSNAKLIFAAAFIYAVIDFARKDRPEKTIKLLEQFTARVPALRDGSFKAISKQQLVPGDIVQIESGVTVPADLRLLETVNLRIQEALLTTEVGAVEKHTAQLTGENLPLWEHSNMAYMGTLVTQGRGLGLVVATGMQTELGKIADLIQKVEPQATPLQKSLTNIERKLAAFGVGASILFLLGASALGNPLADSLRISVSLLVALAPVGFSTLLLGVFLRESKNASASKFSALEALGAVTVICSDKTGTLTESRVTVTILDFSGHDLDLTETMSKSGALHSTRELGARTQSALSLTAIGGSLCNDAKLIDIGDERYHTLGDPTESALAAAAAQMGYWKSSLDVSFPRAAELPFDSERKRMTTVHHLGQYDPEALAGLDVSDKRYIAFTRGNLQSLLEIASHVWVEGKALEIDAESRSRIEALNERLAKRGMRVVGVGFRLLNAIPEIIQTDLEQNITLAGLFGMIDPPREGVREALEACHAVGIRPLMLTGDHPLIALEIARQLGIAENGRALRGIDVENFSVDELKNVIDDVDVFARVASEHKLKIVQALQAQGHVVAITGDSVNDAPALRKADVGMALGLAGAEVAKDAANLILADDNFATLVSAVKAGRQVLENLRQAIHFIVAGNLSRFLALWLLALMTKDIVLLPAQLLWLSFGVDVLLGLGLALQRSNLPRKINAGRTLWLGAWMGILAAGLGWWSFSAVQPAWHTLVFMALALMQVAHALALSLRKATLGIALFVILVQWLLAPMYGAGNLLMIIGAGAIIFIALRFTESK